jgi:hypothetical protein
MDYFWHIHHENTYQNTLNSLTPSMSFGERG